MADQADTAVQFIPYQRICYEHLQGFRGQPVTIVGTPGIKDGEFTTLNMVDGNVRVQGIDGLQENTKEFVIEIRGTLDEEGVVQIQEYTEMTSDFDLVTYYKVVKLMQAQFKNLFYQD